MMGANVRDKMLITALSLFGVLSMLLGAALIYVGKGTEAAVLISVATTATGALAVAYKGAISATDNPQPPILPSVKIETKPESPKVEA